MREFQAYYFNVAMRKWEPGNAHILYFYLSLIGFFLAIGAWLLSWAVQMGYISPDGIKGYPARAHTELILFASVLPALMGLSHHRGLFNDDLRQKWSYNIVFLSGLLLILLLSFLTVRVPARAVASIIMLLFGLELLPYRTGRNPAASWIQVGSYMGAAGALFWALSSMDKYSWMYLTGESLIYAGFLMPIYIGIIGLNGSHKNLQFPLTPGKQKGIFAPGPVSLYVFVATFLVEFLFRFIMRKNPPLPITGTVRMLVFGYWLVLSRGGNIIIQLKGTTGLFWKISMASVFFGLIGYIIGVDYRSHYTHFFYIGGIALALLLVLPQPNPKKETILFSGSVFFLVAMGRAFATPSASSYPDQIGALALLLIIAVVYYIIRERRNILKDRN